MINLKLVICEKPSVATALARVIGARKRQDGYIEGNGYIVSWCIGHLVELAQPAAYDEKYAKWRRADLPILPEEWKYEVSASTRKQFGILKKLMERPDVDSLICATDAGREGELIFRLVYEQAGCRKPFERLWISSMEDAAIKEGFENLKPGAEYDSLYSAALCRARADWIVGMNATRLFSCLYGQTLNIGRVMTPTLAMVVARDAAIRSFQPEAYYTPELDLGVLKVRGEKLQNMEAAAQIADTCRTAGTAEIRHVEQKEKSERPPALYDLTALQRDANRILGYTAQQTLNYAQSLYEKKLITYPRTDSRYLTDDMAEMLPELVQAMQQKLGIQPDNPVLVNAAQVINGKKVTDHHALIPTRTAAGADLSALPSGEQAIFRMIATRLLCAVGEPHRYLEISVEAECAENLFHAKGRVELEPGWKLYAGCDGDTLQEMDAEETGPVPVLTGDMAFSIENVAVREGRTSPPKRFTEDLLLHAMQTASAEEFPKESEHKGIGTPATRASIIEKLVKKGFIERRQEKKKQALYATEKGAALITVLPEQLQSPSMTADWEEKLLKIEQGAYSPEAFMDEISGMVTDLVQNYEPAESAMVLLPTGGKVIGKCPACRAEVHETKRGWFCRNAGCQFALWKDNHFFQTIGKEMDERTAEKLLKTGKAYLPNCRSKKTGKLYNATVLLSTGENGRAVFELTFDSKKEAGK